MNKKAFLKREDFNKMIIGSILTVGFNFIFNRIAKTNSFIEFGKLFINNLGIIVLCAGILYIVYIIMAAAIRNLVEKTIRKTTEEILKSNYEKIDSLSKQFLELTDKVEKLNIRMDGYYQTIHDSALLWCATNTMLIREILIKKVFTDAEFEEAIKSCPDFYLEKLKDLFGERIYKLAQLSKIGKEIEIGEYNLLVKKQLREFIERNITNQQQNELTGNSGTVPGED
jgi:hypothetical protein